MITYNAEGVKLPKIGKRETTKWIKAVAETHGKKVGEIGYMFVDDEKILEVNNEYLGHDYYTDVITFDYCEENELNGDIGHRSNQCRKVWKDLRGRALSGHYSRNFAPLWHQRQRSRRT